MDELSPFSLLAGYVLLYLLSFLGVVRKKRHEERTRLLSLVSRVRVISRMLESINNLE